MAGLIDQIEEPLASAIWVSSALRSVNTVGTPLVSAVANFSGEAIADEYALTFSAVDPVAHTGVVHVGTLSPNNPYRNVSGVSVLLDNATVFSSVVPGSDLVFSNSGLFSNTWAAVVKVGLFKGTFNAYGSGAGVPNTPRQHRVLNTDTGAAADCKVTLKPSAIQIHTTGVVFALVKPFAETAAEKQAGSGSQRIMPYHVTLANVTGSGAAKVGDLLIDGATVLVQNLSTGATGASVALNVVDNYKILSGGLASVEFKLSQLMTNAATANILIFSARYVQIAPDVAGAPGTFATADVILTQTGEAAGTIQPSGVAYWWEQILVPEGANAESNPYPSNIFLTGKQTGTAGWVA